MREYSTTGLRWWLHNMVNYLKNLSNCTHDLDELHDFRICRNKVMKVYNHVPLLSLNSSFLTTNKFHIMHFVRGSQISSVFVGSLSLLFF